MFWLKQVYYGLLGLCLIALLLNFKRHDKEVRIYLPVVLLAIIIQSAGDIIKAKGFDHYFVFNIYIPIEYLLLSLYYFRVILNKTIRLSILMSGILFFVYYSLYYVLYPEAFFEDSFLPFVISSFLLSLCVITFFIQLFLKEEAIHLLRFPSFWINVGNLVFYSGCLFVMGFYFSLKEKDPDLAGELLYINYILNLFLYLMYLVAFTCFKTKKT